MLNDLDATPEMRQEGNIFKELRPPKLPDQLYITALNDEGVASKKGSQANEENLDPNLILSGKFLHQENKTCKRMRI